VLLGALDRARGEKVPECEGTVFAARCFSFGSAATGHALAAREALAITVRYAIDVIRYALSTSSGSDVIQPSDSELLRRAQQGDATAFATLIRRHDRYLYRVARSVLPNDQEAEDVVQETFLRAFTRLSDFRGLATLRTWLTRIALNEAIRLRRQHRSTFEIVSLRAARADSPVQADGHVVGDADPERAAARNQIRRVLERAIDGLPAAFRLVLVLRDVEELSVAQTAKLLGIREETVKTRLHRARRMLREALGEQIASALKDIFPFERPRCDRLVQRLLNQLGFSRSVQASR
jgi:RNA polymerase sigma-70 factor (ECF subfamily)